MQLGQCAGTFSHELTHVAQRVSGKPIRVEMAPRRPGDPPVLVGAADRARALLGWAPTRSRLLQAAALPRRDVRLRCDPAVEFASQQDNELEARTLPACARTLAFSAASSKATTSRRSRATVMQRETFEKILWAMPVEGPGRCISI
jgi:hypothetical protein